MRGFWTSIAMVVAILTIGCGPEFVHADNTGGAGGMAAATSGPAGPGGFGANGAGGALPGAGGGAIVMPGCAQPMMEDAFESSSVDPGVWFVDGSGADQGDGKLILDLMPGEQLRAVRSVLEFEPTDKTTTLWLAEVNSINGAVGVRYFGTGGDQEYHSIYIEDDRLRAARFTMAGDQPIANVPFNGEAHRFLRFREVGSNNMFYETSADGSTWELLAEASTLAAAKGPNRLEIWASATQPNSLIGSFEHVIVCAP